MEVFVYGTLTDPDRAAAVLDSFAYRGPAVLRGLHRADGAYPTLAPGGEVRGRILETGDVAALDRYEGVDDRLYVRVSVPLAADETEGDTENEGESTFERPPVDSETVEIYVGNPDRLDAPVEWPGEGSFADRVRAYGRDNEVAVVPREAADETETGSGVDR